MRLVRYSQAIEYAVQRGLEAMIYHRLGLGPLEIKNTIRYLIVEVLNTQRKSYLFAHACRSTSRRVNNRGTARR